MDLLDRLKLERPVAQAGMGGGLAGADLAAAVARGGGLGTLGLLDPRGLRAELRRARILAPGRPIAINLLLPFTSRAHVDVCVAERVDAAVLFFGFRPDLVARLRDARVPVLHQVGTPDEARRAVQDGADAIVAQGREAGGHLLGTEGALAFLPRALEAANGRPVLAAGGFVSPGDVRAALDAGAAAVLCGTRFLLTRECRAHPAYKARALGARRTLETTLFGFGWPARHRVVPNAATDRWCAEDGTPRLAARVLAGASEGLGRHAPLGRPGLVGSLQRAALPVFGPEAPIEGMPARTVESMALYAGTAAARVDSVGSAEDLVRWLSP